MCMEDKDSVHATCQSSRAAATHDLDEQRDDSRPGEADPGADQDVAGHGGHLV